MKRNINIHKTISIYYNMLRKHFDLGALAGQPGQPWLKYFYYFHVAKGADMNEIRAIRLQPGIRPIRAITANQAAAGQRFSDD